MKNYNEESIKSLSDLEHVRLRPALYVGDTSPRPIELPIINGDGVEFKAYEVSLGYVVCIREILDNAIDIIRHTGKGTHVWINYDPNKKKFTIRDNSVGVPIGKHELGIYTPQVVFETLRSGKNFDTNEFFIGMNGMGASLTNFFSKSFKVTINRDNKIYRQVWKDAVSRNPSISNGNGSTGTIVEFVLNSKYFHNWEPTEEFIEQFVKCTAIFNTDIKFKYNNKVIRTRGLKDFKIGDEYYRKSGKVELFVSPAYETTQDFKMLTIVNGVPTFFGGTHSDLIMEGLLRAVKTELKMRGQMVHRSNILKGMNVIFKLNDIKNISFSSQSKTELITTWHELGSGIESHTFDVAKRFVKSEKSGWLKFIEDQFEKKKVKVQIARFKRKSVEYFHAKKRQNGEVYIVEGQSAKSQMMSVRLDNQGVLPLRGKILNVAERRLSEVVKSDTVISIIDMLGIDIDGTTNCPYEKIIIATDADPDGLHIQSLLITFFNYLAPELIDRMYVLRSPLYVVEKGPRYNLYYDKKSFQRAQSKGADVRYNKGLGSLQLKEWKAMCDPSQRQLIKLTNESSSKLHTTISRLFSGDSTYRKKWLGSSLPIYKLD